MAAAFGAVFDLVTSPGKAAWRHSAMPVWLWSPRQNRVRWANGAALALWGAKSYPALSTLTDPAAQPGLARLARIAASLPRDQARIERLRFFLNGRAMNLTCRCELIRLESERLVAVSVLDQVPGLTAHENEAHELLEGLEAPALAASPDGTLLFANATAGDAAAYDGVEALVASLAGADETSGMLTRDGTRLRVRARLVGGTVAILIDDKTAAPSPVKEAPAPPAAVEDTEGPADIADADEPAATEVIFNPAWPTWDDGSGEDQPAAQARRDDTPEEGNVLLFRSGGAARTEDADTPDEDDDTPLASHERDAFRYLARALGARMEGEDADAAALETEPTVQATRPQPAAAPAPRSGGPLALDADDAQMLLSRLPLGVLIYRQANALYANRAFLEMFGFANFTELTQAGDVSRLMPRLEADDAALLDHGRGEGGVRPALLVARDLAGRAMRVVARLQAVRWQGEAAMLLSVRPPDGGLVARSDDGTAEPRPAAPTQETERAASSDNELETIVALATDGVAILDEDGSITLLDRQAEGLLAVSTADMAGKPFAALFAHDSRSSVAAYLGSIRGADVPRLVGKGRRVTALVAEGAEMPLHLVMGRLSDAPERRYCAVLRDISQSLKTEADLTAARKQAEAVSKQKSEFIGRVSHELRTPLNSILGFSEVMLEERFGAVGNERYLNYLRDIHDSGQHVLSLVNDLLDLSRVEAGKLELNFTSVDVNEVAVESIRLMLQEAARGRVIVRSSLGRRLPQIVADHRSLRQMLLNLLSNAIKFTLPGGQVVLSTRLTDAGEVQIRVRDTGIGMEQQDIAVAMEPFRQVATAPAPRTPGAGLGLPLTKALAHANRAEFRIESRTGAGTLTEITFPPRKVLAT